MRVTTDTLVLIRLHKKADLLDAKFMALKIERFVQTKIYFDLERNGHHRFSSVGGRSFVAVRQ